MTKVVTRNYGNNDSLSGTDKEDNSSNFDESVSGSINPKSEEDGSDERDESPNEHTKIEELSFEDNAFEKLELRNLKNEVLSSILQNDEEFIEEGRVVREAINRGINAFTPDLFFDKLVKDYSAAEKLFGPKIIRWLSGYEPSYVDRNIRIPEFQRELKGRIEEKIRKLRKDEFIEKDGMINEAGIDIATLALYMEELENIVPKEEFGEREQKKNFLYGERSGEKNYKKGDRYKDIALKKSVKKAIRRGHSSLHTSDLVVFQRKNRGTSHIIYAMDSSGSMKGNKIDMSKKAGVALAYRAIENLDKVGLIVFGDEISESIMPTDDFGQLLRSITKSKASNQTNIVLPIQQSQQMFPDENVTKHLILLTDALPTAGKEPEDETIEAVAIAVSAGITISVIGINLDKKGKELAKKIVEIGQGRLYTVKDVDELDKVILEEYEEIRGV